VPAYTVEGAHEDYGDATFAIAPGDILAVGDGQTFDADHSVDPLRRVGSLMVIVASTKDGDHEMELETNLDKIRIVLCKADFQAYSEMKAVPLLTTHLTTTLVLPVLMEAIQLLDDPDGPPECKWAKLLRRRLDAETFGPASNTLEKAQRLLKFPIRRALESAKAFLDKPGS
jgi:hypothetical protein